MSPFCKDNDVNSPYVLGREGAESTEPFNGRRGRGFQDREESRTECEAGKVEELKHSFVRRQDNAEARIEPARGIECSPENIEQDNESV